MEKAVELLHRTKEAPTDEKAAHFEQFLRLIRCVPYFHPHPAPASPPLTSPSSPPLTLAILKFGSATIA
jgi:hypothetical protein